MLRYVVVRWCHGLSHGSALECRCPLVPAGRGGGGDKRAAPRLFRSVGGDVREQEKACVFAAEYSEVNRPARIKWYAQ